MSREFVYGQGHSERPILEFLALYLVAWTAFLTGVLALYKKSERPPLAMILFFAVSTRLVLLPSGLIQENDVYRYVLDGQVIMHGENPFEFSPSVLPQKASEDLRRSLELPEARLVLQRIGYPEVATIYPPAAQVAFALGATLGGWNWMGQRLVFLGADFLLMAVLISLLRRISLSSSWLILYAWNPLILKEIANSVHLDVLVALFLVLVLLGLLKYRERPTVLRLMSSATAFGMAILSKLYPLLLMPAILHYLLRAGTGSRRMVQFFAVAMATVFLGYLTFLSVEFAQLTAGLSTYTSQWRMNDGLFSILAAFLSSPRVVAAVLISVLAILLPILQGSRSLAELSGNFQWILLFWYLTIPTPYPWYAVPLAALAVTRPNGAASMVTVVLSGVVGLYYLNFFYEYHEYEGAWWLWTRSIEHGIIWLTLILALILRPLVQRDQGFGLSTSHL